MRWLEVRNENAALVPALPVKRSSSDGGTENGTECAVISKEFEHSIDHMAHQAIVDIAKQTHRAYCWLNGCASFHLRSMAQLRRDRVAEKLT